MEYEKDFYLEILERHSKRNSAEGFVAKTLLDWIMERPERMLYKEEAVDVFYYYYTYPNSGGLEPFMRFSAQHDVKCMTIPELMKKIENNVITPFAVFKEHRKIEFKHTRNLASIATSSLEWEKKKDEARKLLEVSESPVDERKSVIVARLRRKLQRRKK